MTGKQVFGYVAQPAEQMVRQQINHMDRGSWCELGPGDGLVVHVERGTRSGVKLVKGVSLSNMMGARVGDLDALAAYKVLELLDQGYMVIARALTHCPCIMARPVLLWVDGDEATIEEELRATVEDALAHVMEFLK